MSCCTIPYSHMNQNYKDNEENEDAIKLVDLEDIVATTNTASVVDVETDRTGTYVKNEMQINSLVDQAHEIEQEYANNNVLDFDILDENKELDQLLGGDLYKQALEENPYYHINTEIAAQMNRVTDVGEISLPVHTKSNQTDKVKLRTYTEDILDHIASALSSDNDYFSSHKDSFESLNRKMAKKHGQLYKKVDLYYMYCVICKEKEIQPCNIIRGLLQTNSFRSQSGVMVYAIFTAPYFKYGTNGKLKSFSCPHQCRFCPHMPGYPVSYVPGEPGLDRAHGVDYDVVAQVHTRASAYSASGHINDKAEVIVLGGTWHAYPLKYRRQFIRDLYYAFNTVHENRDRRRKTMKQEIKINENSKCRVIGLTLETRPDRINADELIEFREMGVTRVQIGIQHTNDRILIRSQRGCSAESGVRAIKMLKDNGFKVDIHIMPDLPKPFTHKFEEENKSKLLSSDLMFTSDDIDWDFNSVSEDWKMFQEIFFSEKYCPDQVKIYPCEVMDWTGIKEDFEKGTHVPYGTIKPNQLSNPLIELLIQLKSIFPEECRINRLIRDIPEEYVLGGIKDAGGRQRIERMMKQRELNCSCMRCREIKKSKVNPIDVRLKITNFKASGGDEYFLQYVTVTNDLVGFLRLRISPDSGKCTSYYRDGSVHEVKTVFPELIDCAMIRELHVYGEAVAVNRSKESSTIRSQQHAGYGTKLLHNAFILAKMLGKNKMSVIPGEGVKAYYRRYGFVDGKNFLFKDMTDFNISDYMTDFTMDQIIHKVHSFDQNKLIPLEYIPTNISIPDTKGQSDSNTMESNTMESNTMESNTIESNTMESNTMESNTMESNTMESNTIESNTMESNTMESNTMDSNYWFLIILFVIMIGIAQIIDYLIVLYTKNQ